MDSNKIIVICGPTATGKTELGIKLAKKYHAEIVSADSRQVYKGMDIGTGKDIPRNSKFKIQNSKLQIKNKKFEVGFYLVEKIPLWLLDIVELDYQFNVGEYKKVAKKVMANIISRGKLPIIVGGTGLYIKAITQELPLVNIPPDQKLRNELNNLGITKLKDKLKVIDEKKFLGMNNSDRNNPRRLVRAIEIAYYLQFFPNYSSSPSTSLGINSARSLQSSSRPASPDSNNKNVLIIGLTAPKEILFQRVIKRIKKRLKQGIIKEIKTLLEQGFSWDLPSMSGLGYKEFRPYFENKTKLDEVLKIWQKDEINYIKRQLVWFKKMTGINWFDITKTDFYTEVDNLVCRFLAGPLL